jgi:hypothetical protein
MPEHTLPIPERPDTFDLAANLRHVCATSLAGLFHVVMGEPDANGDAWLLDRACDRLEAMEARGLCLEFVVAVRDLLEAITDAHSDEESIRSLAHASDAWDAAAAAWSAWDRAERGAVACE